MATFVIRNGELVEKAITSYVDRPQRPISDTQDLLWHPVANVYTDSKSRFRRMTKDAGCIEVGNSINSLPRKAPRMNSYEDRRQRANDIKRAIHELRNGRS